MAGKLSFVLPVTLHETGLAVTGSGSWRNSPDDGILMKTKLLLNSFLRQFNQNDLAEFIVVSPACDLSVLSTLISSVTCDPRFKLVPELDVCPGIRRLVDPRTRQIEGWRAQQMIKLAMSSHVSTEYYVTLDSDIICMRPSSYDLLVRNNRALTNIETPADYRRLYTDLFAEKESLYKGQRYRRSAAILGYDHLDRTPRFYGETPVVLHASSVNHLKHYLGGASRQDWSDLLAQESGWTEYSLYYQFLEMMGQLELQCSLAGCNTVLDLERSVWQATVHYRQSRPYDITHFTVDIADTEVGFFLAVQSWLPALSWLPVSCATVTEFYKELETWLFAH